MTDQLGNRRRITTVMTTVLACLVPLLAGAVAYLVIRDVNQGRDIVQANVSARFDDCRAGEDIRAALRDEVEESRRNSRLFLELVPDFDTPEVRRLIRESQDRRLRAYAPRDCRDYALEAVPPGDGHSYEVP